MAFQTCGFFTFQTCLARFKPSFGFGGALLLFRNGADLCFFLAKILHQRDVAWADIRTGAALNTVRQIMGGSFIVLLADAEPVELLRQKIRRTGVGAGAAADAVLLLLRRAHLCGGWREQAVSDFYHRHIEAGQGEAHQRAAHNHQLFAGRNKACVLQQVAHRRADTRPDVARPPYGFAGQRHHALGERLAVDNSALDRKRGANVLHQHADI
ncbi:hypothetical protein BN135_145 [Cronobacter muytjensii 530]